METAGQIVPVPLLLRPNISSIAGIKVSLKENVLMQFSKNLPTLLIRIGFQDSRPLGIDVIGSESPLVFSPPVRAENKELSDLCNISWSSR